MSSFADEVAEIAAQYPDSRSAVLPALRLAQERHEGWLPPDAFREVGDALGLTPAYCHAVASFYDMFHLEPVGRHLVEVCTNVSCALVGAQAVLEAFESALGVRAGETTADGAVTLRAIECAGGCGWGTVVTIDSRYREPVKPEDVPAILEELRGGVGSTEPRESGAGGLPPAGAGNSGVGSTEPRESGAGGLPPAGAGNA